VILKNAVNRSLSHWRKPINPFTALSFPRRREFVEPKYVVIPHHVRDDKKKEYGMSGVAGEDDRRGKKAIIN
jgi:hypothetical protein